MCVYSLHADLICDFCAACLCALGGTDHDCSLWVLAFGAGSAHSGQEGIQARSVCPHLFKYQRPSESHRKCVRVRASVWASLPQKLFFVNTLYKNILTFQFIEHVPTISTVTGGNLSCTCCSFTAKGHWRMENKHITCTTVHNSNGFLLRSVKLFIADRWHSTGLKGWNRIALYTFLFSKKCCCLLKKMSFAWNLYFTYFKICSFKEMFLYWLCLSIAACNTFSLTVLLGDAVVKLGKSRHLGLSCKLQVS